MKCGYLDPSPLFHDRVHAITSTSDHTSTATAGQMLKADANGLPVDATNTDTDVADAVSKKHTQNTDTGTTGNTFTVDSDSTTGKLILDVALGAADKSLTLTNAALTDNRVITFPDATGTVELTGHTQNASTIIIPSGMGTPTYDDLQDFLNMHQSSGRLTGGVLSAHAGPDGTLDISAMEGMIHTANTLGSPLIYFKRAAEASLALTDTAVNYIIITYTAPGGVPTLTYSASASRPVENTYNAFVAGRCWRSGNNVEVLTTGRNIYDSYGRAHDRLLNKYGTMDRASGAVLTAHATPLRLSCTAGVWYYGDTRIDTGAADKFHVWYKTGGGAWTESAELTLFSEVFDGGASKVYETYQNGTSLGTLSGSKYGAYWIYTCPEGELYVVLGTGNYANIGAAQAATVPASLPPYVSDWGRLIGRVICQKTSAAFYSVESVWTTAFTLSTAVDHASLANVTPMSATGHPAATAAVDGYATATQITKLDGIAATAQVNVLEGVTGTAPIVVGAIAAKSQAISISAATTSAAGSMSSADKAKLDGIFDTANPEALGVAAPGTQVIAARRDHVHAMPSASDVGAATASHTHANGLMTVDVVATDFTVPSGNTAIYNNMQVPPARTVTVVGVLVDPGWS
jgi:hypothetical protein